MATASADWSTYDTIGGWTQRSDNRLEFREGVVTRGLRERRWIILDEVNRADIDKCFGELFTVLSGGTVTTAYEREVRGRMTPVVLGSAEGPYRFDKHVRMIATMNVRDKASLFRLSYAFMRRFAAVHVPALDDKSLRELAQQRGATLGLSHEVCELAASALSRDRGLGVATALGPALLLDMLDYVAARGMQVSAQPAVMRRAVAEAVELLVFPQLEGVTREAAGSAAGRLEDLFRDASVVSELRASLRTYLPFL